MNHPAKVLFLLFLLAPCLASQAAEPVAAKTVLAELGLREYSVASRDLPGWKVPRKIVVRTLSSKQAEALRSVLPGIEVVGVQSLEQARAEIADADVLLGYCDEALLQQAKKLRWLQVYWAGVEDCVGLEKIQSGEIILTNGQRIGSPALAEHSIAMMMMLMRGLDIHYTQQKEGVWQRDVGNPESTFIELSGRTALVLGLGGIGTQVAERAHALGMRVLATRGSRREGPDYIEYVGLSDETNTLAKQADVVINTLPLTKRTRGMLDAGFFQSMKPTAYYISVGRGATTVTDDLVAALEKGELAGAGLDVVDPEPLPAGHPLWSMPRVIITPHTASRSDRSTQRLFMLVGENLKRYVAGDALLSVVDAKRGY
ncbi:MAG: phosphoglycerate dehydrogenase-like enzyme [Halioglobus sp.]|jgi:phosphoglycerate dehydrogenase-like enzyme